MRRHFATVVRAPYYALTRSFQRVYETLLSFPPLVLLLERKNAFIVYIFGYLIVFIEHNFLPIQWDRWVPFARRGREGSCVVSRSVDE